MFFVLPYGRKQEGHENLFEIRIISGGSVRTFCCYQDNDLVVGMPNFVKNTQKTSILENEERTENYSIIGDMIWL